MTERSASGDEFALALSLQEDDSCFSLDELSRVTGLAVQEICELVEFGVFEPGGGSPDRWAFSGHTVVLARTAHRLRSHFEVNTAGLALALTYLQQIDELKAYIRLLECQHLR